MVGIDIVKISRIAEALKKSGFVSRILTDAEKEYAYNKSGAVLQESTIAGLFAAKEAILKALRVGITNGFGFLDIEISYEANGAPVVKISKKLQKKLEEFSSNSVTVSISHDGEYATAIAMLMKN